jgi:hypothetical protein
VRVEAMMLFPDAVQRAADPGSFHIISSRKPE